MAYKVLYRKYRPKDFNDLYGQDNVKKVLIEELKNSKLSHAYLFYGPKGTGKTSTAKLFAKAINCENCIDGIPCNKCKECQKYNESSDIIEIDAASYNSVDDIRELRDNAKILPTSGKYKIYIIDETHMLSNSAWNAFLKLLEEPPEHVIFILATTEFQKVPLTILSRCQIFSFQRIKNSVIVENLKRISINENFKITDEAINYIAEMSDGAMRNALSILDQLSKVKNEIDIDLIQETFGIISNNEIKILFESLSNKDTSNVNVIFDNYVEKGIDINILISKIVNYLYSIEINESSEEKREKYIHLAFEITNCYNKADAIILIKMLLYHYFPGNNDDTNISQEIFVEEKNVEKSQELLENVEQITDKKEIKTKKTPKNLITNEITPEIKKIRINNSFVEANKKLKNSFIENWKKVTTELEISNYNEIFSLVEETEIMVVSPTNVLFINNSKSTSLLFNENIQELEKKYNKLFETNYKFLCLDSEEWKNEFEIFKINQLKKYEYKYIEEPKDKNINKSLDNAKNIFGEDILDER